MANLKKRIRPARPDLSPLIEVVDENNSNYDTNDYISNSNTSAPGQNEKQLLAIMAAPRTSQPVAFRNLVTPVATAAAPQVMRPVAIAASAPGGGGGAFKPSASAFSAFKKKGGKRTSKNLKRRGLKSRRYTRR